MIFTFNKGLTFLLNLVIFSLLKLLPIIILLYILRKIYKSKNTEYSYKIFDFDFNGYCIIIYLFCYFSVILWIRIKCFSQTTDLKLIINFFKEKYVTLYSLTTIINITIFLLLLLCVIYFFSILHKFFIKQITKRFLILQVNSNIDLSPYVLFVLERKINNILSQIIDYLFNSQIVINFIWKLSYRSVNFIIMVMPTIILYLFFTYEMLFNNFVITPNFYRYLFFYFIYHTYKKTSLFIADTDLGLNHILFRMYYKEKSIRYVNIPQEYQKVILRYIQLGLHRNMKKNPEPLLDNIFGEFCYYINQNCEFHLTTNGEYINNDSSFCDVITKEDIIIYPYYYTQNFIKTSLRILFGENK